MKVWKAIMESVGFAGALIGMLWWLGVTPEMVGEQVYAVSYAVLPLVMLASGIFIGWNAKKRQLAKAAGEKGEDQPEPLKGEQALNFVRHLTDNQHDILREMYESGGTILADPLDGDLQQLAKYGMVERPSLFAPGVDTKWTLPPNVNMIIRDHPDVLMTEEKKAAEQPRAEDELKLKMMKGFSKQKARAILDAFEADGYVEIGDFENEVMASIQRNEGIFLREAWRAYGMSVAGRNYCITDEWRAFLRDSSVFAMLKELADPE